MFALNSRHAREENLCEITTFQTGYDFFTESLEIKVIINELTHSFIIPTSSYNLKAEFVANLKKMFEIIDFVKNKILKLKKLAATI